MSIQNAIAAMRDQIDAADGYARMNRTKQDHPNIMTTWEIQNSNMRGLLDELEEKFRIDRVRQMYMAFVTGYEETYYCEYKDSWPVPYQFADAGLGDAYLAGRSFGHGVPAYKASVLNLAQEHLGDKVFYFYHRIAEGDDNFLAWCLKQEFDKVYTSEPKE